MQLMRYRIRESVGDPVTSLSLSFCSAWNFVKDKRPRDPIREVVCKWLYSMSYSRYFDIFLFLLPNLSLYTVQGKGLEISRKIHLSCLSSALKDSMLLSLELPVGLGARQWKNSLVCTYFPNKFSSRAIGSMSYSKWNENRNGIS